MADYKRKPIIVQTVRWNGHAFTENPLWLSEAMDKRPGEIGAVVAFTGQLHIWTITGDIQAKPGDFIIREVDGSIYPVHPEIFLKAYEPHN